ncbi:MAG: hypothetical protein WD595_02275 [Waddliaceae bacterium]
MNPLVEYKETKDLIEQLIPYGPSHLVLEYLFDVANDYLKLAEFLHKNNLCIKSFFKREFLPSPIYSPKLSKIMVLIHIISLYHYLSGYTVKKEAFDQFKQIQVFDQEKIIDDDLYSKRLKGMKSQMLALSIVQKENYVIPDIEHYFTIGLLIKGVRNRSIFFVLMNYLQAVLLHDRPQFQTQFKQIDICIKIYCTKSEFLLS